MPDALLFCEDAAQEYFLRPLLARLAAEVGIHLATHVRIARGGFGHAFRGLRELEQAHQRDEERMPEALVVTVDANCKGYNARRREVHESAATLKDLIVPAIPDPHIERWYLLDGNAFKCVLGRGCRAPDDKCEKDRYKHLLAQAVTDAGRKPLLGGIEYAEDLAAKMDLNRASKQDASFAHFVNECRAMLRRLKRGAE